MNPIHQLEGWHPIWVAFLATCFTWAMTALGAAIVFVKRDVDRRVMDAMLGFAAGVMIAASYWSLLAPAIEMTKESGAPAWLPAVVGFLAGGVLLRLADFLLPHLHPSRTAGLEPEGIRTTWRRTTLLVLAITLHNVPEGLAVGVAVGAAGAGLPSATLPAALALAFGIGIQNLPEGLAVSMPLRREGISRGRSFWYGQLSGLVEPVAGVLGAAAVLVARPILPYALAFAAGAMIFVVAEELIPESQRGEYSHLATAGLMLGFAVMMLLDVAFG